MEVEVRTQARRLEDQEGNQIEVHGSEELPPARHTWSSRVLIGVDVVVGLHGALDVVVSCTDGVGTVYTGLSDAVARGRGCRRVAHPLVCA